MVLRRLLTTGIWLAAAASLATPVAAQPTNHVVNSTGASVFTDRLVPLAGDATQLVYTRTHAVPHGSVVPSQYGGIRYDDAHRTLVLRTDDGTTSTIGTIDFDGQGWSLVGSSLATETHSRHPAVHWWNLASGKSGEFTLSDKQSYVGAAPGGTVISASQGRLLLRKPNGNTSPLGVPFIGAPAITGAAADVNGVVVSAYSPERVAYEKWSDPGAFTQLTPPVGANVICTSVTAAYAACADSVPGTPALLPLDGGGAVATGSDFFATPAISGSTLLYTSGTDDPLKLASVPSGGSTTYAASAVGRELVSAYGEAVGTSPDDSELYAATDATHISPLVGPFTSPTQVAGFALSHGSITWVDDRSDANHPNVFDLVHQRSVTATAHHVTLGSPDVVAEMPGGIAPTNAIGLVGAAGDNLAYPVYDESDHTSRITIETAAGSTNSRPQATLLGVSSRWVVTSEDSVLALDTTDQTKSSVSDARPYSSSLSGNRLGLLSRRHMVVIDLATGKQTTIKDRGVYQTYGIAVSGKWVGWTIHGRAHWRKLTHGSAVHSAKGTVLGLSARGVLLGNRKAIGYFGSSRPLGPFRHASTPVKLLPFHGGHANSLLPQQVFTQLPQLVGHALAWIDVHGQLKIRPV